MAKNQLNYKKLLKLGYSKEDIFKLASSLLISANQMAKQHVLSAFSMDELKNLEKKLKKESPDKKDQQILMLEQAYHDKTGQYFTQLVGEKLQFLMDVFAQAASKNRELMANFFKLPEDKQDKIQQALKKGRIDVLDQLEK